MRTNKILSGILGLTLCMTAGTAFAAEMKYSATLTGAEEVPPVTTDATGMVNATYDTESKMLSWTTEASGLSGDPSAAHFHGPAKMGDNAKPVVPVALDMLDKGSVELTETQARDLADGMWYFNIHTAAHPDGEIRGQVMPAK